MSVIKKKKNRTGQDSNTPSFAQDWAETGFEDYY